MGRVKDSLVDRPPTIGDLRHQGVVALKVRCRRPCKRVGRVALDALRLPDATVVADLEAAADALQSLRSLRARFEPIWPVQPAKLAGTADTPYARWVLTVEGVGEAAGISSPLWSGQHAATFARRQIAEGGKVLRVETPTGVMEADQIEAWLSSDRF